MAFDFDDLDEGFVLPPELAGVEAMSDEDFEKFGERLRKAERLGKFEDFDRAVTEALWDEGKVEARVGVVLKEFLALLHEVARSTKEEKYVERSGAAIMHTLSAFSTSCSQHEVRTRRGGEGAPCALILGFGGSHVAELEEQAKFYSSLGYTAISLSNCSSPALLKAKQAAKVGHELRTALAGGQKLHVHICSNWGFNKWIDLMHEWNEGCVPMDSLPPLRECWASAVIECAPQCMTDPATGEVVPLPGSVLSEPPKPPGDGGGAPPVAMTPSQPAPAPAAASPGEAAGVNESWKEGMEMLMRVHLMVMMACIGANFKRWAPEAEWSKQVYGEKKFMNFLRSAAQHGAFWLGEEAARRARAKHRALPEGVILGDDRGEWLPGSGCEGVELDNDAFAHWEHMDVAVQPPVPRLFLYTSEDKVILAKFSEAYARHTARYNPHAKVFTRKCKISEHCRLWNTEYDECAEAVLELLGSAGLPTAR